MSLTHKSLAAGRWFELSIIEQMANIGSEVYRTIKAFREKNEGSFQNAFERALELFDLTLSDNRWRGRTKEIARSREMFCTLFFDSKNIKNLDEEMDSLDKYFLEFAIAARHQKSKQKKN